MTQTTGHPLTSARIDSWITAVRLAKTRATASTDCKAGRVTINGSKAKPSSIVRLDDEVTIRRDGATRIVRVRQIIVKRVGAAIATQCYSDHTPVVEQTAPTAAFARRDRGAGRPTKRERRDIDRLRGR